MEFLAEFAAVISKLVNPVGKSGGTAFELANPFTT
jgi:hypothetical protein